MTRGVLGSGDFTLRDNPKQYRLLYYKKNKKRILQKSKERYWTNPEKYKQKSKDNYWKFKQKEVLLKDLSSVDQNHN